MVGFQKQRSCTTGTDSDSYAGLVRNHDDVSSSGFRIEGLDVASCTVAWKSVGMYSLQVAV